VPKAFFHNETSGCAKGKNHEERSEELLAETNNGISLSKAFSFSAVHSEPSDKIAKKKISRGEREGEVSP
jgi:hypothetical protein